VLVVASQYPLQPAAQPGAAPLAHVVLDDPYVLKYELDEVAAMDVHHDAEPIALIVYLGGGFGGGGTVFPRWPRAGAVGGRGRCRCCGGAGSAGASGTGSREAGSREAGSREAGSREAGSSADGPESSGAKGTESSADGPESGSGASADGSGCGCESGCGCDCDSNGCVESTQEADRDLAFFFFFFFQTAVDMISICPFLRLAHQFSLAHPLSLFFNRVAWAYLY
jgi:hypothetical protein